MRLVALCWFVLLVLTFSTVLLLPPSVRYQEGVVDSDGCTSIRSLNASFHSPFFQDIDLLQNPVELHISHGVNYYTPLSEYLPTDAPEKILCIPPYSEMAMKADIEGVLSADISAIKTYLCFAMEKLFEHILFSFILAQNRVHGEHMREGAFRRKGEGAAPKANSTTSQRSSLFNIMGDRCEELLFIPPEVLPKISFSFVATDSQKIQGIERIIYNSEGDLPRMQDIVQKSVSNLRVNLLKTYRSARLAHKNDLVAVHIASLIRTLADLVKSGMIHVANTSDLYLPTEATVDGRCFLWFPRADESWRNVLNGENKGPLRENSHLQSSILFDEEGDIVEAYDYGDQIDMLDIIPLGVLGDGAEDFMFYKCLRAFRTRFGENYCERNFRKILNQTWSLVSNASNQKGLSCKEAIFMSPSGHSGNFCFSGPPSAKLKILLSKASGIERFFRRSGTSVPEVLSEHYQAQKISEMNSPTLEMMGYEFEMMSSAADERSTIPHDLLHKENAHALRKKGACDIDVSSNLRQAVIKFWESHIVGMNRSIGPYSSNVQRETQVFLNRLKEVEIVCPCSVASGSSSKTRAIRA